MKISLMSVSVRDQEKALKFYTDILGFIKKNDIPIGGDRWLTVVSPEDPDGPELLLEPNGEYPPMKQLKEALFKDRIPAAAFEVTDVEAEYSRLKEAGVDFLQPPLESMGVLLAIFNDTSGNLIQMYQLLEK